MKRWTGNSFVLALGGVFAAASLFAQTVSLDLKTGDHISGRILSETTNGLVLSNAWSRELVIPLSEILKRTAVTAGTNALAANAATNAATKTNAVALAKAVAATNSIFNVPALKNWHAEVLVGADLTFSERNREVYNAKAKFTYAKDRFKTIFDYDATYGRSEVDETIVVNGVSTTRQVMKTDANRMNGSIKNDFDLTKKWYVYNIAAMGYDEIRRIDLRYEIGPGMGYRLIQQTNFLLNTEAGANYQREDRADGDTLSTFFFRFAEMATWKITPRLSWDEKFEYMPRVEDFGQYRMRFETNFRYALLQNVFVNLSLVDLYDSQPANGVTQNDLQVRSSVGVKF